MEGEENEGREGKQGWREKKMKEGKEKGENWASFFAQEDASPPPERLRGGRPPTRIPRVCKCALG